MEFCVFRWLSWTWTTVAPPKLKVWQKSTQIYSFSVWSVLVSQGTFLITLFEASQFRETIFLQLESVGRFNIQLRSVYLTTAIRKHLKIGFILYPKLEKVDIRFSIGVEKRFLMELRSGYCAVFQKLNYCFGCHLKPFGNHMAKSLMNVTSFSSISYCSNSEYWPQKHVQSGNIHSKILDVYVERQSAQNYIEHQFHSSTTILINIKSLPTIFNSGRTRLG